MEQCLTTEVEYHDIQLGKCALRRHKDEYDIEDDERSRHRKDGKDKNTPLMIT